MLLLVSHREFYAITRRGAFLRARRWCWSPAWSRLLVGWGLVALFPGALEAGGQSAAVGRQPRLGGLVGGRRVRRPPAALDRTPLGLFGALALLNAAAALFRSQRMEAALHGDEEARIRALLARYGSQDSLGYFATRRDKAVVFAPSGRAASPTGWRPVSASPAATRSATAAAWSRPSTPGSTWPAYAWAPAVMGASEEGAKAYARAGLSALQLGDEAILDAADFDLDGRDMRSPGRPSTGSRAPAYVPDPPARGLTERR